MKNWLFLLTFLISGITLNAQEYIPLFDAHSKYISRGKAAIKSVPQNTPLVAEFYNSFNVVPYRTVAVDPTVILPGSVLFIPQLAHTVLPNGRYHDGYFLAHGVLSQKNKKQICIFSEKGKNPFVVNKKELDIFVVRGNMAKTIRLQYKLDYQPKKFKPTYKMVASDFEKLMQKGNKNMPSIHARIQHYSALGKGTPYLIYNLGEGEQDAVDPDPKIDFARTDCMTFCEHTLALAISNSYPEMYANLQKIRYKKGEISYTARNHFTIADWLPNNNWLLKDVTAQVGAGYTKKMQKTIDRPTFYKRNGASKEAIAKAAKKEFFEVDYIPTEHLLKIKERLKGGEIVSIVTTHPMVISAHMGIIVRDKWNNVVFRHASSSARTNEVMDVRLEEMVSDLTGSKTRVGMIFMRANQAATPPY